MTINFEDRATFIGGSDAAAVLGVSRWQTPYQLWLEKTKQWTPAPDPDRERRFTRGKFLEPYVLDVLLRELREAGHEIDVLNRNGGWIDPEHKFLACELDFEARMDGEEYNGEIKTVHPFGAGDWGDAGTDEIPIDYTAQAQHGMMVRRRDKCIVAALIGSDDLRIHQVPRDDELITHLRAAEVEFWRRVQEMDPPAPINLQDLAHLVPLSRDAEIAIAADSELHHDLLRLRAIKGAAAEADLLEFRIKREMGDAARLALDGKTVATWKADKTGVRRFRLK